MKDMSMAEYDRIINTPVSKTPQQIADKIHQDIYKNDSVHRVIHSCPCYHLALYYLGITDSHGLYWPDGKGGNEWNKGTDNE